MRTCSAEQPKGEVPLVDRLAVPATLALVAMCAIPDVAFAAGPGVSPSLKNLLLSVGGGAAVLAAIAIGIAGVSTFDPVKRGGRCVLSLCFFTSMRVVLSPVFSAQCYSLLILLLLTVDTFCRAT